MSWVIWILAAIISSFIEEQKFKERVANGESLKYHIFCALYIGIVAVGIGAFTVAMGLAKVSS